MLDDNAAVDWVSLRTQYVDAGLKNVSLSNFHGVAVRNATIYGKYFPTHTGSKPPPPKRARSRSANLHPYRITSRNIQTLELAHACVQHYERCSTTSSSRCFMRNELACAGSCISH